MFSEQTLMNAGVLVVAATAGGSITSGLAGFVFDVMLIVRAPLQLFQAIQTSILPHLTGLEARESDEEFRRAIRITILAIAAFAGAVAIGLLLIGPFVMKALLNRRASVQPLRPRGRRDRYGSASDLRYAQPGAAGPQEGPNRGRRVADRGDGVRRVRRDRAGQHAVGPGAGASSSATAAPPACWR